MRDLRNIHSGSKFGIGLREFFFQSKELFLANFDISKNCKNHIEDNEKYAVDLAKKCPRKSIKRPLIVMETTRQRGS